ncbi:MAG: glucose-1-phosphate cytidylyltransferase [Flammeovirgaceae bacterium]|nr:glucose-1-phosphate cytidylyltransferase [Flammeovirgaceae bacterium]
MKAVIFAGGFGTRISEESGVRPKPMVEIGGKPILWHIMKSYSQHGINEFIVCCGYKGYFIKDYFARYFNYTSDFTLDMATNSMEIHKSVAEPWKLTLIDTGLHTMTGGRLKRVKEYIGNETFCLTYGDGVSDIDITASIEFHKKHGGQATLTAVQQPGRFGAFKLNDSNPKINQFREKPVGDGRESAWINGGYFVLEPEVIDLIDGDDTVWEREPLEKLANSGNLSAFQHYGFWQPMDTLRDKNVLENMWQEGKAPWKKWD